MSECGKVVSTAGGIWITGKVGCVEDARAELLAGRLDAGAVPDRANERRGGTA
jgi:hypothetical protein